MHPPLSSQQTLLCSVWMDGPQEEPEVSSLSWRTKVTYGGFRLFLSSFQYLVRSSVRIAVYRETLLMPIKTQAAAVSLTKSLDFLLGFGVCHPVREM